MIEEVTLVDIDQVGDYGLLVNFSDGTTARYSVEELLELRPYRESSADPKKLNSFALPHAVED